MPIASPGEQQEIGEAVPRGMTLRIQSLALPELR